MSINVPNCLFFILIIIIGCLLFINNKPKSGFGGWVSQHTDDISDRQCGLTSMLPIICLYMPIVYRHITGLHTKLEEGRLKPYVDPDGKVTNTLVEYDPETGKVVWGLNSNDYKITPEIINYMYNFIRDDSCNKVLDMNTEYKLASICDIPLLRKKYSHGDVEFNYGSFLRAMLNIHGNFSDTSLQKQVTQQGQTRLNYKYNVGIIDYSPDKPATRLCIEISHDFGEGGNPTHLEAMWYWLAKLCTMGNKPGNTPVIQAFILFSSKMEHITSVIPRDDDGKGGALDQKYWIFYDDIPGMTPALYGGAPIWNTGGIMKFFSHTKSTKVYVFIDKEDLPFISMGNTAEKRLYPLRRGGAIPPDPDSEDEYWSFYDQYHQSRQPAVPSD